MLLIKKTLLLTYLFSQLLLLSSYSYPKIIESKNIIDVLKYVNKVADDTLVVFDIDDTLIQSIEYIGTSLLTHQIAKKLAKNGMNFEKALDVGLNVWENLIDMLSFEKIEEDVITLFENLKVKNTKIMGLTARPPSVSAETHKHLISLGISFENNKPYNKKIIFDDKTHFIDGILYIGLKNKGEKLLLFLETIKYKPKQIIFVDDSYNNVVNVNTKLNTEKISNICIHYPRTKERFCNLSQQEIDTKVFFALQQAISKEIGHFSALSALL
jgi:FMN phosphatase YigB (HAD superfamily)